MRPAWFNDNGAVVLEHADHSFIVKSITTFTCRERYCPSLGPKEAEMTKAPLSLFAVLLLIMVSGVQAQQPRQGTIAIAPTNITRPQSVTLTVTSANGIDLSQIGTSQVAIQPGDGISLLQAIPQPGVNELRVDFSIDASAEL